MLHIKNNIPPKLGAFLIGLYVLALSGCSTTQLVKNDDVDIKQYTELYLISPKDDSRNVVPTVIDEFKKMGFNITVIDPEKPAIGAQGTGFLFSNNGHILTCAHVIGDAKEATIWLDGIRYETEVIAFDETLDLAILKTRSPVKGIVPISFKNSSKYRMGEDIFTIGYPISNLLGNNARLSKGLISSPTGLKDDPNQIQISAEIQPGNSGGPILDDDGIVIGVVQQTLNPWKMAQQTGGALPQNINFGIKANIVLDFIKSNDENLYSEINFDAVSDFEAVNMAVAKIKSGIIPIELEDAPKLVAHLEYKSMWDIWFRFRYFIFSFYDYDSQELIFKAGLGRDNPFSTEKSVINDTFLKIRKALNIPPPSSNKNQQ